MDRKGFAFDSLTNIMLWVLIVLLAGFSIYSLFKKFGLG